MVGSHLLHVVVDHDLHELFEACSLRIPSELVLCLCRIAPEVDNIGRTIESLAYGHYSLADEVREAWVADRSHDALLIDALTFPTKFDACIVEGE